jgi:hypothetical protein
MATTEISSSLLKQFSLINIYGKSGTGKTTYALQLLLHFLPQRLFDQRLEPRFVWVQASEKFPKKRLIEMYRDDTHLLQYLQTHILLYPQYLIGNYDELCGRLNSLFENSDTLPFIPAAIVIDNISHYLRLEISNYKDVSIITNLLDDFFDMIIVPLCFYCGRRGITLILIHEVTYDPKQDKTVMFNHNLFSNLKSLNIKLEKSPITNRQVISFHYKGNVKSFRYQLQKKGIKIYT